MGSFGRLGPGRNLLESFPRKHCGIDAERDPLAFGCRHDLILHLWVIVRMMVMFYPVLERQATSLLPCLVGILRFLFPQPLYQAIQGLVGCEDAYDQFVRFPLQRFDTHRR